MTDKDTNSSVAKESSAKLFTWVEMKMVSVNKVAVVPMKKMMGMGKANKVAVVPMKKMMVMGKANKVAVVPMKKMMVM